MKVNLEALKDRAGWEKAGVKLPAYDIDLMRKKTDEKPLWEDDESELARLCGIR